MNNKHTNKIYQQKIRFWSLRYNTIICNEGTRNNFKDIEGRITELSRPGFSIKT